MMTRSGSCPALWASIRIMPGFGRRRLVRRYGSESADGGPDVDQTELSIRLTRRHVQGNTCTVACRNEHMRCLRLCRPALSQPAFEALVSAALSASTLELARGLNYVEAPLHDVELQRIASVASWRVPEHPYAHILAERLWQWRTTGSFPRAAIDGVPDLSEIGDDVCEFDHLTPTLRAADVRGLVSVLEALSPWGLLALLGCRRSAGTVPILPPAAESLVAAFTQRHSPSAALSVGARALAKHGERTCGSNANAYAHAPLPLLTPSRSDPCCTVHRSPSGFWANGQTSLRGSDQEKNAHALAVLERLLRSAIWINVHELPGGGADGQSRGAVFEVRQHEGYGARWSADGHRFRGFVEYAVGPRASIFPPQAEPLSDRPTCARILARLLGRPQAWDVERRAVASASAEPPGLVEHLARPVERRGNGLDRADVAAADAAAAEAAASNEDDAPPDDKMASAAAAERLVCSLGLERCRSSEWLTVAGYGSLMDEESARQTCPSLRDFRYGWVENYCRVFNLASIINIRRGHATQKRLATCTARPRAGSWLRVCLYEMPLTELPALAEREARLRLSSVAHLRELKPGERDGHALMCTEYSDAEYRRERCPSDADYEREVGQYYSGALYRDDLLPVPSYLYRCAKAHALAGNAAIVNFFDASFLGNGITSLREYMQRELDVVEAEPVRAAALGWDLTLEQTAELKLWWSCEK